MKLNILNSAVLLLLMAVLASACKKDEEDDETNTNTNNNNPTTTETNNYLGSASYGDVITYEIDETNKTYKYHNETTGISDSGSYTVSTDANLQGIYEINIGSDNFYAVELAEKAFATSMPSGRTQNKLSFAISSDIDLATDYSISDLAGKYICINYDDNSLNDSTVWGGFELKSDGSYTYNYGPNYAQDFDPSVHFAGLDHGTFSVNSSDPSRLDIHSDVYNEDYVATIYPEKMLLVDNGVGNGFSLGIKYPDSHISQSSVAGTYRFLDLTTDGYQGVGYYNIPASGGNLSYFATYNTSSIPDDNGSSSDFAAVSQVNNLFECSVDYGGETFFTDFILLPGEVMIHFCWGENSGVVSYGVGAKIN